MKKADFKWQVIIGIVGIAFVVIVAVAFYQMWGIPDIRWITYAALAVLMALFLGFLLFIFGGALGFVKGAAWGLGFVALTVSAKELPSWAFGLLILAAVLAFIVRPLVRQYKRDRERGSEAVIDEKAAAAVREEEAVEEELQLQDDAFKASIAFGEKSLLLLANMTGAMVQLIRSGDTLYFARVGGEIRGLDEELLRTDFSREADFLRDKKDFCLQRGEIVSISCRYGREAGTQFPNCGRLTVHTASKRYVFAILDKLPEQQLKQFFAGLPFALKSKKKAEAPAYEPTEQEKRMLPKLRKICLVLTVAGVLAGAAFVFLPGIRLTYSILSVVCILIPAVAFGLYVRYGAVLSVDDSDKSEYKKSAASVTLALMVPSLALLLRTIHDFTVLDWVSLVIWSAAILGAALVLLLTLAKKAARRKTAIFLIAFVLLIYSPCAVLQINGLYDSSEPVVYTSTLLEKDISESRSSTSYEFTVTLQNGAEKDVEVTKEYYNQCEPGQTVTVVEQSGLLGVDYVYIAEEQ